MESCQVSSSMCCVLPGFWARFRRSKTSALARRSNVLRTKRPEQARALKPTTIFVFAFFLEFLELSLQVEGPKKFERPSSIALPPYSGKSELGRGPRNAGGCEGDLASFGGPPWESHFAELAPPLHVLCISPLEKGINSSSVDFG